MALYEKMVLISEQEYLQLKGFQMHVGERHDGDIDYGAGDGDDGDGGDDGDDDGDGDEGGAEQRQRLNERYRTMFQRARERRIMNEPPPPPQRLNEQYADYRRRLRQHLLQHRLDRQVAALPPRTIQRTPLPAASPQLSPGQAAVSTLHHLTPSQTAAATRQGLLHPTVFQPRGSPPVRYTWAAFGSPPSNYGSFYSSSSSRTSSPRNRPPLQTTPLLNKTPAYSAFDSSLSEYGSFHPPITISTISSRNRPPLQTPEPQFGSTPTYGRAARRIQFGPDTPLSQSRGRTAGSGDASFSDIELFADTPRHSEASTTLQNIQLSPEDLGMLENIGVRQPINTIMTLWEP